MEHVIDVKFKFHKETTKDAFAFECRRFSEFMDYLLYSEEITLDQVREWIATRAEA